MDQQNNIDQYIMGTLSPKDMEVFAQRLLTDTNLTIEVKKRRAILSGFEAYGNQKMKMHIQAVRQDMLQQETAKEVTKNTVQRKKIKLWLAVAAVIALMLVAWQLFLNKPVTSEQLFAKSYQPYVLTIGTRETNGREKIIQAESNYKAKNYAAAIPLLEQLIEKTPQASNLGLALGNAYLLSNQTDKAIDHFETIIQNNDPLYIDQARWYLALTYLKKGQHLKCKDILSHLTKNTRADFYKEAKALLKEL